jgi:hypothetical protein
MPIISIPKDKEVIVPYSSLRETLSFGQNEFRRRLCTFMLGKDALLLIASNSSFLYCSRKCMHLIILSETLGNSLDNFIQLGTKSHSVMSAFRLRELRAMPTFFERVETRGYELAK